MVFGLLSDLLPFCTENVVILITIQMHCFIYSKIIVERSATSLQCLRDPEDIDWLIQVSLKSAGWYSSSPGAGFFVPLAFV